MTSRWHERNATTSHRFSRKSGKKYLFHAHPYQAWNPSCSHVPKYQQLFVFSYFFAWQHKLRARKQTPSSLKQIWFACTVKQRWEVLRSEFLMFRIFGILNFRKVELRAFGTQFGPFIFLYDFSLLADVIIHKW